MVELIGGPYDGVSVVAPESFVQGGFVMWVYIAGGSRCWIASGPADNRSWHPYWCETDADADLEHHASFYPKAWKDVEGED